MAIGLPLRKYIDDDGNLDIYPDFVASDFKPRPVKRNDLYLMLGGHNLRVTTVKDTNRFYKGKRERRIFLTCASGCNCCDKFAGRLIHPIKLEILERHLENVTLDKL